VKKLAIVGAQELTRDNAPFEDKSFDIWALTHHAKSEWCKRFDAVIEIHERGLYTKGYHDPSYFEWLKESKQPVYMVDFHPDIKNAVQYPLDEIKESLLDNIKVHGKEVLNFNSSVDYSLALAIYQGYEQIDIYGVEMQHQTEYYEQQLGFSFWVAMTAGKGIKVNLYCTNELFIKPLYGDQDVTTEKVKDFIKGMTEQKVGLREQRLQLDGALLFAKQLLEK